MQNGPARPTLGVVNTVGIICTVNTYMEAKGVVEREMCYRLPLRPTGELSS